MDVKWQLRFMKSHKVHHFFEKYSDFTILVHQKPDGDCLSAALALKIILEEKGKSCQIVLSDQLPEKYRVPDGLHNQRFSNLLCFPGAVNPVLFCKWIPVHIHFQMLF